ncbi:histone acetyltransferase p300-like [Acyrthosiphon pisum]|uniref:histone acetyltransferase n=1 Tax=Acyrthosiphon pisum TaxID=7029 RepID=A0A8R2AF63_ACYPI|nr:histone acetyltransferase p300-like [Acyrthosiphon pisum]XP_008187184.1 histone acetyltransferase p300-like [Acyrthosiphon pisum]|eukprot:XP_003247340.1 PREDICTED: histone acetyltransferase p300-like [Acyrthosiphon pisum]
MLTRWVIFGRRVPVYKCNICASHLGTRYHCTLCNGFDLCITCFKKECHPHNMNKRDVQLYDVTFFRLSVLNYYQKKPEASKSKKFINGINCLLKHSTQCRSCNIPDCKNVKKLLRHGKLCKFKNEGKCPIYDRYLEILKCHCTVYCAQANIPHCPSIHFRI